jgi:uncharacterized repeat protein (TIGR02543 family)
MLLLHWRTCLLAAFCLFGFCFASQAKDYREDTEVVDGVTWTFYVYEENGGFTSTVVAASKYPHLQNVPLTIPGTLGGYPVTGVGIPNWGVNWAHGDEWTGLSIPNSVTNIGPGAFAGTLSCWDAGKWVDYIRMSVTIPNGVTYIGDRAFRSCGALERVTLPANLTYLGKRAFSNCYHLATVTIREGLANIEELTFADCRELANVSIPGTVTSIGDHAFQNCTNLPSVTIPNSVTNIGIGAFENCHNLQDITIPGSVENIPKYAFSHCSRLGSVTIGNGVTNIEMGAFWACTNLTSVTIPDSVRSIPSAFQNCTSLSSVTIGEGVTSMNGGEFYGCGLKTLYVPEWWKGSPLAANVPSGCIVVYGTSMQTVVFDANGGTCATSTNLYPTSGTYSNLPTATRTGYALDGWYTAKSGGEKITADTPVATHVPRTLYAHWSGNGYAVTLDRQGGSGGAGSVTATFASMMPGIAVPTRAGYTFGGYYSAANGEGTQYYTAEGKGVREWDQAGAATLYAHWTANTYVVTLDWQDGTGGTASVAATYGCAMPDLVVPTRTGYTFDGYYGAANGEGTQYYNAAGESVRSWDKASEATLYAKWTLEERVLVENVEAKYVWPWGVGISYEVSGTMPANFPLVVTMTDHAKNATYTALSSALSGDTGAEAGRHRVVWNLDRQGVKLQSSNVTFTVSYEWPLYCVVDLAQENTDEIAGVWYPTSESGEVLLSEGQPIYATRPASSFPVTYLNEPPGGGFNTDGYKTTNLVLRRIDPGTFWMGGSYRTTLTQAFYMGVFETTQKQYLSVMGRGSNPSQYTGEKRPVEKVTWDDIRGNTNWPASAIVGTDSFLGRLRARTGMAFDLPTEAQWEYACRAGTTSAYNNGGDTASDLLKLGRFYRKGVVVQQGSHTEHFYVGSYQPNAWGLYDMHGNVQEWCLDWHGDLSSGATDPQGAASGTGREKRGGSWRIEASGCKSSSRNCSNPSYASDDSGFRIARNLPDISGTSAAVTVQSPGSFDVNKQVEVGFWPFASADEEIEVMLDGAVLFSALGETSFDWQPQTLGAHVLECRVNGVAMANKTVNVVGLAFATAAGPNPPTAQDANLAITPQSKNFGVGGGVYAIVSSGSGTWAASTSDSWITLNAASGQAGYPVAYSVGAATNAEARTGYVYVSGHVHTVTQDGLGATISPESASFESAGGTGTISVTVPDRMGWQARANCDWVRMAQTSGTGSGGATFAVAPLNESATRQGTLTVAGQTFTVFQTGRRMKLGSNSTTQDYLAHTIPITVEALPSTVWQAKPNAAWISVVDAGSGKGNGQVTISIAENPSWKARTGTVAIGTESFTVTQQGRTALEFAISPATATASEEGANGRIAVTATPDLPWSAASQADWLAISGDTGTGAGTGNVSYAAAPNPTLDGRTGKIVVTPGDSKVGAKTHTVSQPAANSELSANGCQFAAVGESREVRVSVADVVQWQIQNTNGWLKVLGETSRVGPATVTLEALPNDTVYARSGTLTLARKTLQVAQRGRDVEVSCEAKVFGEDGGDDTVRIHADGDVSWTAVVSAPTWITIWGGASGTGDGEIRYIVSPCVGSGESRTGTITVGEKVVAITQRPYDLSIAPAGMTVDADGGTGEFRVTTGSGNAWRATETEEWMRLEAGSGTGNGMVRFVCEANDANVGREGRINVEGEMFTVKQQPLFPVAKNTEEVAKALAGVADGWLGGEIRNVEEYDAFRSWVEGNGLNWRAVKESPRAWVSYALGADRLFENEPEIQIDGVGVSRSGSKGEGTGIAMEVSVTVNDGEREVAVDAGKIAGMFEMSRDLADWGGRASATETGGDGATMQFKVFTGDETAQAAFLRLRIAQQAISFDPIAAQTLAGRVELSATSTSGGAVAFEVVSGPGVVNGNELTFTGEGTVMVRAIQAGDDWWLPATAMQAVKVDKVAQTISFAPVGAQAATNRVELSAMATSGLPVTFEVVSGPGVVTGKMLTFTGAGTVMVRAVQAGDEWWSPASATQMVEVGKQTITFAPIGAQAATARVGLSATATSGLPVTFEVMSGPGVIDGNVLSFTGTGTVKVRAVQSGDDWWLPATATQAVTVEKVAQTISFAPVVGQLATGRVELSATATSGLPVTFEVVSGPGVIEGNMLTFTGEGTVDVRVVQAGDEQWLPAAATQVVHVVDASKLYLVVDLSAGFKEEAVWPVSYLGGVPEGGWTDDYKTTKLVLRLVLPGTFTMGSPSGELGRDSGETQHEVTISKPFYMGVFEVTQKQWELVTGSKPSWYKGAIRPVECVSYNMIRGTGVGTNWPADGQVDAGSFMGVLRAKTGRKFDLPTEAQWEYACRAGTTTALNSGKDLTDAYQCANMDEVGRYLYNQSDRRGGYSEHTTVGSYLPNAWGLYDMHGNVWEWCLDWYGSYESGAATDPVGAGSCSWSSRVMRGGCWDYGAATCRSAYRDDGRNPSHTYNFLGFRLSSNLPE